MRFARAAMTVVLICSIGGCKDFAPDGHGRKSTGMPGYVQPPSGFTDLLRQSEGLAVQADAASLTVGSGAAVTRVSNALAQTMSIKDGTTSLAVGAGSAMHGQTAAPGVVVFRKAQVDTDVLVQVLDTTAARVAYVITGADAPTTFDTTVEGVDMKLAQNGVVLSAHGQIVGAATPAWAYDARGQVVPTHYEIHGNVLRQVVEHHSGVTYPVVADPTMSLGAVGKAIGGQLASAVFQYVVGKALDWAIAKAGANGCLALSTFPSCALYPMQHSWTNPAYPNGPAGAIVMPAVVGHRLNEAQTILNQAGLKKIDLVDATGRGRRPLDPENWMVATQAPQAGVNVRPDTPIRLGVSRPSDGQGTGVDPAGTIPNVMCMNLQDAQDKLRAAGFHTTSRDALHSRHQILDRDWVVVNQTPVAGAPASAGALVTMDVVKYGEPTGASNCRS